MDDMKKADHERGYAACRCHSCFPASGSKLRRKLKARANRRARRRLKRELIDRVEQT